MRVATAAILPNSPTYNTGTLAYTAGANAALVVDGVTLAVGDRILVKDQGNTGSTRNGIYVVTTAGSVSVPWVITRATDADTSAEVLSGMRVRVTEGTVNAQTEWALATTGAITLDTTSLSFIQTVFAAAWLPVRVATTAVLPQSGTYGSKAFSALANAALVIDGVTLAVGDRVLVKDQGDSTNGIFVVTNAGSAGSTWTMRRATDAFVSQQFLSGMSVRVTEGTVNGGGQFYLSTTGAITLDTTTLTFTSTAVELGFAAATADQAFTSATPADVTSLSITFTAPPWTSATRPVYVHAHCEVGIITTLQKYLEWLITDGSNTAKGDCFDYAAVAAAGVHPDAWERITAPGSYTRKARAASSNTFTSTVYGSTYPGTFIRAFAT